VTHEDGGEDDDTDFDIEDLQRMNCNRCKKIVMPGEGIRVKNYMVDSGVETVAYCDQDCLDAMPSRGVRGRREIERRREKANIRINNLYKTDAKIEREDIIEETLDWVLGVRDDL